MGFSKIIPAGMCESNNIKFEQACECLIQSIFNEIEFFLLMFIDELIFFFYIFLSYFDYSSEPLMYSPSFFDDILITVRVPK